MQNVYIKLFMQILSVLSVCTSCALLYQATYHSLRGYDFAELYMGNAMLAVLVGVGTDVLCKHDARPSIVFRWMPIVVAILIGWLVPVYN